MQVRSGGDEAAFKASEAKGGWEDRMRRGADTTNTRHRPS